MIIFKFDYRNTELHYLTFYNSIFTNHKNKEINIAALLCLNSNSLLELNKYFINANIYGYECNDLYINYFKKKYLINNDKIKLSKIDFKDGYSTRKLFNSNTVNLFYETEYNKTESYEPYFPLFKNKLIVKYDIIISNITNILDEQIKIIENTYKYLNPGGIFIVENIFENYNEDEYLYKEYLTYFFINGSKVEDFQDYLQKNYLTEIYDIALFTHGMKVGITSSNNSLLERYKDEIRIQICDHNKEVFTVSEDVSIDVEIKNVTPLFIKVFEINTENYYRKNLIIHRF